MTAQHTPRLGRKDPVMLLAAYPNWPLILHCAVRVSPTPARGRRTWLYPCDMPVRDYQYAMARTALFHNTLVCLPTGLGKTLIASVVMLNYYRWGGGPMGPGMVFAEGA